MKINDKKREWKEGRDVCAIDHESNLCFFSVLRSDCNTVYLLSLEGSSILSYGLSKRGTVKTQIIGRCAMSLELPPLVGSGIFLFFYVSQGG